MFMRGNAINKHLSVGFWDLTRSGSLWEGRFHQKLPSPLLNLTKKSKEENCERGCHQQFSNLARTCNQEPGHSTKAWTNPCQALGRGISPFLARAETPRILKIFGANTDFYSWFSWAKQAGVFAKIRCTEGPQVSGNELTHFKSNLHKGRLLQKWAILNTFRSVIGFTW